MTQTVRAATVTPHKLLLVQDLPLHHLQPLFSHLCYSCNQFDLKKGVFFLRRSFLSKLNVRLSLLPPHPHPLSPTVCHFLTESVGMTAAFAPFFGHI